MAKKQPRAKVSRSTRDLLIALLRDHNEIEVARAVSRATRTVVDRNTVSKVKHDQPILEIKAHAFERFFASDENSRVQAGFRHHESRWTSCFRNHQPRDGECRLGRSFTAKEFKTLAINATEGKLGHPASAHFVSRTGQWLKPILRHLLRHPTKCTVAIARPYFDDGASPRVRTQRLGALEFLWNLPNTLDLAFAHDDAELGVATYDWRHDTHVRTVAVFENELVALGVPEPVGPSAPPQWLRGHPLAADWPYGTAEKYKVEVFLQYHREFDRTHQAAMRFFQSEPDVCERKVIDGSECRLPGLREAMHWTKRSGFVIRDESLFAGSRL